MSLDIQFVLEASDADLVVQLLMKALAEQYKLDATSDAGKDACFRIMRPLVYIKSNLDTVTALDAERRLAASAGPSPMAAPPGTPSGWPNNIPGFPGPGMPLPPAPAPQPAYAGSIPTGQGPTKGGR